MDGDGSYDNASPMAADEPHADPGLPQAVSLMLEAAILANLRARRPRASEPPMLEVHVRSFVALVTIDDQNRLVATLSLQRVGEAGDAGVGADGAYAYGGFGGVPASEKAMAALPETTVGEGEAAAKECAVCLEGYESGNKLRMMPCAHAFHGRCIFGWLAVSRLCPLCRFALLAEAESDTEDEDDDDTEGEDDDDDVEHR
ncbi:unnamed protein product [Urochloa humidicola]